MRAWSLALSLLFLLPLAVGLGPMTTLESPSDTFDGFGWSLASQGPWLAVAAPQAYLSNDQSGRVDVYKDEGGRWARVQSIMPPEGTNHFGTSMAFAGTDLLIGTAGVQRDGAWEGAVFVYEENAGTWSLKQTLEPPMADPAGDGQQFGESIAAWGDTAVIGAPIWDDWRGAAYVIQRGAGGWGTPVQVATGDVANDRLGSAVALHGEHLALGAPSASSVSGHVELYARSGDAWTLEQVLEGDMRGRNLGRTLAIDEDRLAVGGPGNKQVAGEVHLYSRTADGWAMDVMLEGGQDAPRGFGRSLALSGDFLAVGWSQDEWAPVAVTVIEVDNGARTDMTSSDPLRWQNSVAWTRLGLMVGAQGLRGDHGSHVDHFDIGPAAQHTDVADTTSKDVPWAQLAGLGLLVAVVASVVVVQLRSRP